MWHYETNVVWTEEATGRLHAQGNPEIEIATPPEFGGPPNMWTPENLLAGALGACLMTSSVYFLRRRDVDLRSYMSTARGTMEKGSEGLTFTGMEAVITVTVGRDTDVEVARAAIEKAEQMCPVSRAFTCPVDVTINVRSEPRA